MDKGPLGVHEVKLVIQYSPSILDGGGVGEAAHCPLDLGQVTSGNNCGWLVVDSNLEASWAPLHKAEGLLALECPDGRIHIFGDHISSVEQTDRHVLSISWITLDHLIVRLEAGISNLSHREPLMVSLKHQFQNVNSP